MAAHKKAVIAWLLAALLFALAPRPAATAAGRGAARIVSLVPAVTEMLYAIGAGPHVVGAQLILESGFHSGRTTRDVMLAAASRLQNK